MPWPCNETKYISHFPETREIWSYGSGYGGNALLGKKCYALRIASAIAHDEGWLAEHMLILKLITPEEKAYYVAAAFPWACGKTNLAMLQPTVPGWRAETVGDDIAWMRFGEDGRLYAVNPEFGFFGVAPGTNWKTNPNAMRTIEQGQLAVHQRRAHRRRRRLVGGHGGRPAAPDVVEGQDWTPDSEEAAAHPNSRYTTPIAQCPVVAPEWEDPKGVPISAILFGGRRAAPCRWSPRPGTGSTARSSAPRCRARRPRRPRARLGDVRRDPMAMLPFLGYNAGDYFQHWIDVGKGADAAKLPKIFYVNWFRRGDDGRFLWPGFGENSRVLKWWSSAWRARPRPTETPIGYVPDPDAARPRRPRRRPVADMAAALAVDVEEWKAEIPLIEEWFDKIGDTLPTSMRDELEALKLRLGL